VNTIRPKQPRLRLDPELYERLQQQVLRRDGWRCQNYGSRSNLEVHYKEFRSQGGDDSEENLINLCVSAIQSCIAKPECLFLVRWQIELAKNCV
jgi:hypothetical protein